MDVSSAGSRYVNTELLVVKSSAFMLTSTYTNPAPATDAGGKHVNVESSVTFPGTTTDPNLHEVLRVWKKADPTIVTAVDAPLTALWAGSTMWTARARGRRGKKRKRGKAKR